jgi:hypothetical protein
LRRDIEELALDTLNNVILELKVEEEDKKAYDSLKKSR